MRDIRKYCQTTALKLSWAPPFLNEASTDIFAYLRPYSSLSNAYLDMGIWVKTANHVVNHSFPPARLTSKLLTFLLSPLSPWQILFICLAVQFLPLSKPVRHSSQRDQRQRYS
jgi:hypothetical protein